MNLIAILLTIAMPVVGVSATAAEARILAKNELGHPVVIALDGKGRPRENADPKTYPSIKYFREDHNYYDYCYEGVEKEAKELLSALVDAANGDGDSWAELISIKIGKDRIVKVVAKITDESGEYEEWYTFPNCK